MGGWAAGIDAFNTLISDLSQPTNDVARVIGAVAKGNLTQRMGLDVEGRPLRGEFLRTAKTVNAMVDQLATFSSEVTRVAREVGTEGKLDRQRRGAAGLRAARRLRAPAPQAGPEPLRRGRGPRGAVRRREEAHPRDGGAARLRADQLGARHGGAQQPRRAARRVANAQADLEEANDRLRAVADELRRARDTAEFANRELETFNSAVAHDLRAPLRSIGGFSQTLLEDHAHQLDEEGQDCLRRVIAGAGRMGQLIDDLLHLSHCTHAPMRQETVDLGALAIVCLEDLTRAQPERRVEVRIAPGLSVTGDPRLLRVVMENLLQNAWKFTSRHEHATIEVGRDPATGACFVRDDGAGFEMAHAGNLFQAFQRLHRVDEFEGNGIGLITARRIVERHGGRIWGTGAREAGATFYFTTG